MEADIAVNDSTSIWITSSDNLSFVITMKPSIGKAIMGLPICRMDLKILAEDLLYGNADCLMHIRLTSTESHAVGERLLAIASGVW